jgi:hypothetical protein
MKKEDQSAEKPSDQKTLPFFTRYLERTKKIKTDLKAGSPKWPPRL